MKALAPKLLLAILSVCLCAGAFAHPRPEIDVGWVRTVAGLEALEKTATTIALDIRKDGERSLVDALVKRFPDVENLKLYYFRHKVEQSVFESLAGLKKLHTLELSGDASLVDTDFEFIGKMANLTHLSFSLP